LATPLQHVKSELFRALAHPQRIRILKSLRRASDRPTQGALNLDQPLCRNTWLRCARDLVRVRRARAGLLLPTQPAHRGSAESGAELLNHRLRNQSMLRELRREDRRSVVYSRDRRTGVVPNPGARRRRRHYRRRIDRRARALFGRALAIRRGCRLVQQLRARIAAGGPV
jgi:hypothetical protein